MNDQSWKLEGFSKFAKKTPTIQILTKNVHLLHKAYFSFDIVQFKPNHWIEFKLFRVDEPQKNC